MCWTDITCTSPDTNQSVSATVGSEDRYRSLLSFCGADSGQQHRLVAPQSGGSFDGARVATVELHILFGVSDEEGTSLGEVVDLASGHINIGRNAASQMQQCVQFHGVFRRYLEGISVQTLGHYWCEIEIGQRIPQQ